MPSVTPRPLAKCCRKAFRGRLCDGRRDRRCRLAFQAGGKQETGWQREGKVRGREFTVRGTADVRWNVRK